MILLQLAITIAAALLGSPSFVRCPRDWWASAPTWPSPRAACAWSREDGSGRVELWVPLACAGLVRGERVVVCRGVIHVTGGEL
jgi:hypothetical protein